MEAIQTTGSVDDGQIEAAVNEFLVEKFLPSPEAELANDTNLVETGILDSVSVLGLVDFMEEGYDIMIEPDDLFRLTTVNNIAEVIREKSGL